MRLKPTNIYNKLRTETGMLKIKRVELCLFLKRTCSPSKSLFPKNYDIYNRGTQSITVRC